jgi:hypothetical protein
MTGNTFAYYMPTSTDRNEIYGTNSDRDMGVTISGGFLKSKLIYNLGAFSGRRDARDQAPLRVVGRVAYNFLDVDKYWGTNLGQGKTFTIGGGFDTQGSFVDAGLDLFLDYPVTDAGSLTVNGAFSYITGGNNPDRKYSFAELVPTQNMQVIDVGYYFKSCKLQPWLRYGRQDVSSESKQIGRGDADFDKQYSATILGGGINYFFNGHNTNLKLSYTSFGRGVEQDSGEIVDKTYGQVRLTLQVRFF